MGFSLRKICNVRVVSGIVRGKGYSAQIYKGQKAILNVINTLNFVFDVAPLHELVMYLINGTKMVVERTLKRQ